MNQQTSNTPTTQSTVQQIVDPKTYSSILPSDKFTNANKTAQTQQTPSIKDQAAELYRKGINAAKKTTADAEEELRKLATAGGPVIRSNSAQAAQIPAAQVPAAQIPAQAAQVPAAQIPAQAAQVPAAQIPAQAAQVPAAQVPQTEIPVSIPGHTYNISRSLSKAGVVKDGKLQNVSGQWFGNSNHSIDAATKLQSMPEFQRLPPDIQSHINASAQGKDNLDLNKLQPHFHLLPDDMRKDLASKGITLNLAKPTAVASAQAAQSAAAPATKADDKKADTKIQTPAQAAQIPAAQSAAERQPRPTITPRKLGIQLGPTPADLAPSATPAQQNQTVQQIVNPNAYDAILRQPRPTITSPKLANQLGPTPADLAVSPLGNTTQADTTDKVPDGYKAQPYAKFSKDLGIDQKTLAQTPVDVSNAKMQNTSNNIEKQQPPEKDELDRITQLANVPKVPDVLAPLAGSVDDRLQVPDTRTPFQKSTIGQLLGAPGPPPQRDLPVAPFVPNQLKPTPDNYNGFEPGDEKTAANYRYSPIDPQGTVIDIMSGDKPGTAMRNAGLAPTGYIAPPFDPKAAAKARADHNDNVLDPFLGNPPGTTNKALDNVPDINLPSIPKGAASDAVRNQQPELTPRNLSQKIQPNAADLAQAAPSTAPNPELDRITKLSGITPKTPEPAKTPTITTPAKTPAPEPDKTPAPKPEPTKPETPAPEPAKTPAPKPEPTKPETPAPSEPAKTPAPTTPAKQTDTNTDTTNTDNNDNDNENESSELDRLLEQYKEFKFIY